MFRNMGIKKYIIIATYSILLYLGLSNLQVLFSTFSGFLDVMNPIIIGVCISFIFNILMKFYEEHPLKNVGKKHEQMLKYKRGISITLTYLTVILFIATIIFFIVPQITKSAKMFILSASTYTDNFEEFIDGIINKINASFGGMIGTNTWEEIFKWSEKLMTTFTQYLTESMYNIVNSTINFTTNIIDFFIGIILSIYMLASKEKLISIMRKISYAFIKKPQAEKIDRVCTKANVVFSRFVGGQLTEAVILSCLCFIGMTLLKLPYAPLVAVLMGVTSVLPIVGAYIGTVISSLIILLDDPFKMIIFLIFILALQQFEGNLIYPRVVGNAIGIDGIWVFLAIVIGGGFFGVLGILISVPLTALIYALMSEFINGKLKDQGLVEFVNSKNPAPLYVKKAKPKKTKINKIIKKW